MTIWKYDLNGRDWPNFKLEMPVGAKLLCVQMQQRPFSADHPEMPCLWAKVDPSAPLIKRDIRVHPTGDSTEPHAMGVYVGTYQENDYEYVWHVFDYGEHNE